MSQYLCLFSLILQGLHEEGECRQLEFWAGKGADIRDLFCTTPKSQNFTRASFRIYKKYWAKEVPEGGTHHPRGWGRALPPWVRPCLVGHLVGPRCPSSAIWCLLPWKNHKEAFGMKRRCLEAEPWRNQSRALAELFCQGNFPLGGGNHHHRHHH